MPKKNERFQVTAVGTFMVSIPVIADSLEEALQLARTMSTDCWIKKADASGDVIDHGHEITSVWKE